jgi:hypothetical protein
LRDGEEMKKDIIKGEYGPAGTPEMHMREKIYKLERRVSDLEERLNNIVITRKDTD